MVAGVAEVEVMTAPHRVQGKTVIFPPEEEEEWAWWRRGERWGEELRESVREVGRVWGEGSYDGLLCFSQVLLFLIIMLNIPHSGRVLH